MCKKTRKEVSDFTRFKRINEYGIAAIFSILIGAAMYVALVFTKETKWENDPIDGPGNYVYYNMEYLISAIVFTIGGVVCDIVAGLLIICGKFNSQWASKLKNKLIFGLIGLLLVGPVMFFIFTCIAKKKAKKEQQKQVPITEQYKNNPFNSAQDSNQMPQSNPFSDQ